MKRIEYRTADKTSWGDGPWQSEPDKIQWLDEVTGLPCLMKRVSHSGHWCGYVGVPKAHPAHGKDYDNVYRGQDGNHAVHWFPTKAEAMEARRFGAPIACIPISLDFEEGEGL